MTDVFKEHEYAKDVPPTNLQSQVPPSTSDVSSIPVPSDVAPTFTSNHTPFIDVSPASKDTDTSTSGVFVGDKNDNRDETELFTEEQEKLYNQTL